MSNQADQLATLPTKTLQAMLKKAATLPLESLLNSGKVRIDTAGRRVFRDSFWKGSFAPDTALGLAGALGVPTPGGAPFAQGSFWKRFDRIEDGAARGNVVNYEVHWLPGDPEVRAVDYPDARRKYFAQGAPILLLHYRNEPYRIVYDAMKVIDQDRAIGVMHLGSFPNGLEFATFVMERHNYPFAKMSAADLRLLSADPDVTAMLPEEAVGEWEGTLLSLADPDRVLLSQVNPHQLQVRVERKGGRLRLRYRIGVVSGTEDVALSEERSESAEERVFGREVLSLGGTAMAGRWVTQDMKLLKLPGMAQYAEPAGEGFAFHFFLDRAG